MGCLAYKAIDVKKPYFLEGFDSPNGLPRPVHLLWHFMIDEKMIKLTLLRKCLSKMVAKYFYLIHTFVICGIIVSSTIDMSALLEIIF